MEKPWFRNNVTCRERTESERGDLRGGGSGGGGWRESALALALELGED